MGLGDSIETAFSILVGLAFVAGAAVVGAAVLFWKWWTR